MTAYSVAELEEIAAHRPPGPGAAQGRHRAQPRRRAAERLARRASAAAERARSTQSWTVTGIWSHFSSSDEPDDPANDAQERRSTRPSSGPPGPGWRARGRATWPTPPPRSCGPSSRLDLVRVGIASYGLDPAPGVTGDIGLRPAMTARASLAMVKHVEAGDAVSYGRTWVADRATTLGLVPAGYADGLPRVGGNRAEVQVGGQAAQAPRPDLHGPARRRPRRRRPRRRGRGHRLRHRRATASRPPRTGPRPAARSATRS